MSNANNTKTETITLSVFIQDLVKCSFFGCDVVEAMTGKHQNYCFGTKGCLVIEKQPAFTKRKKKGMFSMGLKLTLKECSVAVYNKLYIEHNKMNLSFEAFNLSALGGILKAIGLAVGTY